MINTWNEIELFEVNEQKLSEMRKKMRKQIRELMVKGNRFSLKTNRK